MSQLLTMLVWIGAEVGMSLVGVGFAVVLGGSGVIVELRSFQKFKRARDYPSPEVC
jgi:hypothetical protein